MSRMGRIVVSVLIVLLAAGTVISWNNEVKKDEDLDGLRWRSLYESKNERSLKMVPLFLMTSFSLIAMGRSSLPTHLWIDSSTGPLQIWRDCP